MSGGEVEQMSSGEWCALGQCPRNGQIFETTRENLLLTSGYWGISRHFHYVPEIALAIAWSAPAGLDHLLPWFYVVFLTILLADRANRDDARCAGKYGTPWDEYRAQVAFEIIPWVY